MAAIGSAVSLTEITFYIGVRFRDPAITPSLSLNLISAVQHLYFMVAAPAVFLPWQTAFAALGVIFLKRLTLPEALTAFAGVQVVWWLAAAFALIVRRGKLVDALSSSQSD